jgi:hypothetical protein
MSAKHTPGPWITDEECTNAITIRHDPGNPHADGNKIASVYRDGDDIDAQMRADARLIAAAPAMLAELQWLYEKHGYQSTADAIAKATEPK